MEQGIELLRELASSLGTTVEYLWPILVRAQFAKGILDMLLIGLVILTTLAIIRWFWNNAYKLDDDGVRDVTDVERAQAWIGLFLGLVFIVISVGTVLSYGSEPILRLTNPEYMALQDVTDMIKPPEKK